MIVDGTESRGAQRRRHAGRDILGRPANGGRPCSPSVSHPMPSLDTIDTTTPRSVLTSRPTPRSMGSTLVGRRCSPSPSRAAVSNSSRRPDERSVLMETDRLLAPIEAGVPSPGTAQGSTAPLSYACSALGLSLGLITRHDPSIAGRHDPLPGEPGRGGPVVSARPPDAFAYRADVGQNLPISWLSRCEICGARTRRG